VKNISTLLKCRPKISGKSDFSYHVGKEVQEVFLGGVED